MHCNQQQLRLWVMVLLSSSSTMAFAPTSTVSVSQPRVGETNTRIFASAAAALPEGIIKTISKPGNGEIANLGDVATVKYSCYLPGDEEGQPFAKAQKQKMIVGDGSMVLGWEKVLKTMTIGERSIIRITDSNLGYGAAGVPPLIPPNAQIEFDIELLDVQPPITNIDFDSIATADNTPRTAIDIQLAYEQRQALKALDGPEKEGLEGWIEKAKGFYFFGFFEGETGERAPWLLRPSITFPVAFAIVGAAFYISISSGAISERGANVKDELDEIVLSMSTVGSSSSALLATMMTMMSSTGVDGLDM